MAGLAGGCRRPCVRGPAVPAGDIMLNVQIARTSSRASNGFGFCSGSMRLPVRLGGYPNMAVLASTLGRRIQQLANRGWTATLSGFLAVIPHATRGFARIEAARRTTNPNITISWKGHHVDLGADDGPRNACFAAAPMLHVSQRILTPADCRSV